MKGVIINQTSFRMKGNVFVSGLTAFIILILCVRLSGHQGMLFFVFCFIYILLCRPSEDSLQCSTIPDDSPSKDWQSTVGWGECWIQTRTAVSQSGVVANEPPLLSGHQGMYSICMYKTLPALPIGWIQEAT
jgi:hypothetical protein